MSVIGACQHPGLSQAGSLFSNTDARNFEPGRNPCSASSRTVHRGVHPFSVESSFPK